MKTLTKLQCKQIIGLLSTDTCFFICSALQRIEKSEISDYDARILELESFGVKEGFLEEIRSEYSSRRYAFCFPDEKDSNIGRIELLEAYMLTLED